MTGFLFTLAAFALALGVLIVVHELGHYWVARFCGVKILRFSIGFGKSLWLRKIGETEWSVAAFPLGGFVKMLDEREGEVLPSEAHRAFNRQPVYSRFAIVLAGPAFNLILATFFYFILFVHGVPGMKPILGPVAPHSAAALASFEKGETLTKINSQTVQTWDEARWILIQEAVKQSVATVETQDEKGHISEHRLDLKGMDVDNPDFIRELGFDLFQIDIPPVIGQVVPNGPASKAGLKAGDEIVAIEGMAVKKWEEVSDTIRSKGQNRLNISLKREGIRMDIQIVPDLVPEGSKKIGKIGIAPKIDQGKIDQLFTTVSFPPVQALGKALQKTWETSAFTLKMLGKMAMGEASLKNVGGPLTIADYAGQSAKMGFVPYVGFLALISISLGVLNLLPIPVLDGGHLMYYMAEIISGKPLSDAVMEIGQKIGVTLLFCLMALAIYNDIHRLITG